VSFSIQTNVNSLVAQENLRVNGDFQSRTINRLTSGYRINSSGDDAAGLAVANKFRSDIAELSQGVRNANDGISQLQIIDGGLANISKMLDRMKTLATQSASTTFTGNRDTLNNEYKTLMGEIDRQAANVGLGRAATSSDTNAAANAKKISVYIGGGSVQANSKVEIDLSSGSQVDSTGLGLTGTGISDMGSVSLDGQDLRTATDIFQGGKETFTFSFADGTSATVTFDASAAGATGYSADQVLAAFNNSTELKAHNISAALDTSGKLSFQSSSSFLLKADVTDNIAGTHVNGAAVASEYYNNTNQAYAKWTVAGLDLDDTTASATLAQKVTITDASNGATIAEHTWSLNDGGTESITGSQMVTDLQNALKGTSVSFISDGTEAVFQSATTKFKISVSTSVTNNGDYDTTNGFGAGLYAGSDPATEVTTAAGASSTAASNAIAATGDASGALTRIDAAVRALGIVQGKVGTGQNQLQYSITLANSQIANFSAAESRIRDADVASEAANLTKAQVLQQASLAAMAQANSAPQAVMALLRG
jgi:flagellin